MSNILDAKLKGIHLVNESYISNFIRNTYFDDKRENINKKSYFE